MNFPWFLLVFLFPHLVSSSSLTDNDFETDLGAWKSDKTDTSAWLVQNYDEYWSIPRPTQGTSYVTLYSADCRDLELLRHLYSPNVTIQPGDAISFKYFISDPTGKGAKISLWTTDKWLTVLDPPENAEWHSIIIPIDVETPVNSSFYFEGLVYSHMARVAIDDVRLVSLGDENESSEPPYSDNTTVSNINNDFETDLGAWQNIPQGYQAGWLIENYNEIFYIARPKNGTAYLRAFRHNCYTGHVKLRLESTVEPVQPGDALAFNLVMYSVRKTTETTTATTTTPPITDWWTSEPITIVTESPTPTPFEEISTLTVLFLSRNGQKTLFKTETNPNEAWYPVILPLNLNDDSIGMFAFELESYYDYDTVAIDDIRLLSLTNEENLPN